MIADSEFYENGSKHTLYCTETDTGLAHVRQEVGQGIRQWAEIGAKMEKP